MENDGKVRIQVITNAESVAKHFQKLDKSIKDTSKSTKKLDTTASVLKSTIKDLIAVLSVRQIISFSKELVKTTLTLEALDNKLIASAGSAELAGQSYQFVSEEAERLGIDLQSALDGFAGFSASALRSNLTFKETQQIFSDVSSALITLNSDTATTSRVFRALEQIASKGVVSMEELKLQLGDALPGAMAIASKSVGKTQAEFIKMLSAGEIIAKDFLPAFAEEIRRSLGSNVERASQSARANFNRLNNSILLLKDSLGQQLTPRLSEFSIEIREFIDNEGQDLVKLFAILVDSVSVLAKVLKTAETGFKSFGIVAKTIVDTIKFGNVKDRIDILKDAFKELGEESAGDILDLKNALEKFGEVVVDEKRLRNIENIGKTINESLKIEDSVFDRFKKLAGEFITIDDISKTIGNNLADALTTPFEEGESAGDRFKKVMTSILQEISRQLIATGVAKFISGLFGGSGNITTSEKGNVFANNNVVPFAKGGVVNQPTLFPMQNGAGLMGEAGAEAILPLKRTKEGKLGVETSGQGGGTVNIFNQSQAQIEVIKRPNNDRDIFIREFNSTLTSERSKGAFESALQNQSLRGVQAV